MLIDSHAHLQASQFDADRGEVIERARQKGLTHIIVIGTTFEDSRKALALAQEESMIFATVGIHPHDAKSANESVYAALIEMAKDKHVVAWGEVGLDYFKNYSPQESQREVLRRQIKIARELHLPLVIHNRDAHADLLKILIEEKASEVGGVMHCFSGDRSFAFRCLDLNFFLSIAGPITFGKSHDLREVVKEVPLDRLLIETDAPFLAPHPHRGKRNEPAYVTLIAEKIGEICGLLGETIGERTAQNALKLFRVKERLSPPP
ncbi:MAG: TatD family hydrolase [Candidatus Tectomicrobia bacterium]|nr:TatD family hydrolase [Candidatus Tectomicrobia bacterium]